MRGQPDGVGVSEQCGEPYPENEIAGRDPITCTKDVHPFGMHYNWYRDVSWEGKPLPDRSKKKGSQARVKKVIDAIDEGGKGTRTGPPVSGPPADAVSYWEQHQAQWIAEASRALQQVCKTHQEFTTGDLWPLVDNPAERRAMVQVVRHGLKVGWMSEHAARRETGVWTTKDGVSFPMNKLVPIYLSQIYGNPDV